MNVFTSCTPKCFRSSYILNPNISSNLAQYLYSYFVLEWILEPKDDDRHELTVQLTMDGHETPVHFELASPPRAYSKWFIAGSDADPSRVWNRVGVPSLGQLHGLVYLTTPPFSFRTLQKGEEKKHTYSSCPVLSCFHVFDSARLLFTSSSSPRSPPHGILYGIQTERISRIPHICLFPRKTLLRGEAATEEEGIQSTTNESLFLDRVSDG